MDSANPDKHLRVLPKVLLALVASALVACAPAVRPDAAAPAPIAASRAVAGPAAAISPIPDPAAEECARHDDEEEDADGAAMRPV